MDLDRTWLVLEAALYLFNSLTWVACWKVPAELAECLIMSDLNMFVPFHVWSVSFSSTSSTCHSDACDHLGAICLLPTAHCECSTGPVLPHLAASKGPCGANPRDWFVSYPRHKRWGRGCKYSLPHPQRWPKEQKHYRHWSIGWTPCR